MDLGIKKELSGVPDLRHQVRRLRWFRTSFRHDARLVAERYGVTLDVDDHRLTEAFLAWADVFSQEKANAGVDRRDFAFFTAGLLLRELLRARPVTARPSSAGAVPALAPDEATPIVAFWPEGFLYTNYCLSVLGAVLEQEFGEALTLNAAADNLRTWWSFRENVEEMPSLAIAFLDLFAGNTPNWAMPDLALSRPAMRRAAARLVARGR